MDATVWHDHIDIFGAGTLRKGTWERLLDELKAEHVPSFTLTGKMMLIDESARGRTNATVYRTGAIPDQQIIRILAKYGIEASLGLKSLPQREVAAPIIAARQLEQLDFKPSPAYEAAIGNAIAAAEKIVRCLGGRIMPDWIDKLKERNKALAASGQTQEDLRLHRAKVIRAKAPEFWDSFIERLQADSSKLKEAFPNNTSCQCTVIKTAIDCELRGCKLPWRELSMRLNVDGQSVDIDERKREAPDRIIPAEHHQIKITVNDDEELEFTYKGRAHITPGSLAQHLIEYVCGSLSFAAGSH